MPCLFPITGYRSRERNPATGRRNIVYGLRKGLLDQRVTVPCGQCIECRLEKSRQWAMRAEHEASLYEENCVVTLTYADEHLPKGGSINPEDPVTFMKDLRERVRADTGKVGIRSYGCAEYGEKRGRPHYHIILFNYDFPDKEIDPEMDQTEYKYWRSDLLEEIWGKGRCQIMPCNWETAAYVARYVTKKLTGPRISEYNGKLPERAVCRSMRPGIGRAWFDQNKQHIYKADQVINRGQKMHPPKYYDRRYEIENPQNYKKIKNKRKIKLKNIKLKVENSHYQGDCTNCTHGGRVRAAQVCKEAQFEMLKRTLK